MFGFFAQKVKEGTGDDQKHQACYLLLAATTGQASPNLPIFLLCSRRL